MRFFNQNKIRNDLWRIKKCKTRFIVDTQSRSNLHYFVFLCVHVQYLISVLALTDFTKQDRRIKTPCEFWLTIEERLILHWNNVRVYAKDGVLYRHDEGPDNHKTQVLSLK